MIGWTLKYWQIAGAAALAAGLGACGEGGEGGAPAGEAGEAAAHGEAGEAAIGEGGGEHGEAGVASAYAGVSGPQRIALRLQHLKGFVLAAQQVANSGQAAEAGVLVQQGLLEVYDPAQDQFGDFDASALRAAGEAASSANIQASVRALDAARPREVDYAALAVSLTDIAAGLYQGVLQDGVVDPIEYQHAYGAALSARDALSAGRTALRARDGRAFDEASAALDRFVSLWPSATAPQAPTPYREVLAQSSRVRLALSPFL
jgi:hypothetical protein